MECAWVLVRRHFEGEISIIFINCRLKLDMESNPALLAMSNMEALEEISRLQA